MNYPDVPEGYGPTHIPFQPSQQADPYSQRPASPARQQPAPKQPVKQQARMPKAQALALVRRIKQGIIVGSLLCFSTVTGLIINQTSQASAQQATKSTSSQTTSQGSAKTATTTQTATAAKAATATSQSNTATPTAKTATTSQQGGGYGFGSTQAGQPVSGSHTS